MQKSDHQAVNIHRKPQASTTLNRRYVKRPESRLKGAALESAIQQSPKIKHFNQSAKTATKIQIQDDEPVAPAVTHPMQTSALQRMHSSRNQAVAKQPSARELKDQAIKKALAASAKSVDKENAKQAKKQKKAKLHFGVGRVVLALSCAAAAVFAIAYFVGINMPDITMRVAAMQTGIEASYPGYIPRGFSLSDISSESGKVVLNFKNNESNTAYSLTEENSSWDSNALLTNFVKNEYKENYSIVREQGLTIYVSGSDATWVNGGVVYKLKTSSGELTKKQISSIATSL